MGGSTPQGIPSEERTKAARNKIRLDKEVEHLRTQKNLDHPGRRARIAAAFRSTTVQNSQLLATERDRLSERADQIIREKLGHIKPGDSRIISIRDAADRASQVTTPKDTAKLMNLAEHNGDDVLLTALARECAQRRNPLEPDWWGLFATWMEQKPDGADTLRELATLQVEENDSGHRIIRENAFGVPRPAELAGLSNSQIEALAAQADVIPELPPTMAEQVGKRLAGFMHAEE